MYPHAVRSFAPPRRSSASAAAKMQHTFLGFLAPPMLMRAGFYPSRVPSRNFVRHPEVLLRTA